MLWKYFDKSNGSEEHLIWASGRVVHVADGLQTKWSTAPSRARKVLPAGAVLWDADPEFGEVSGEQCG